MAACPSMGTVVEVAVSWLTSWQGLPRWIREERLAELERALVEDPEMLWARPLLVLPDGTVVCGNQRLLAARRLGLAKLPALIVDLDPVRARLWALRDNNHYGSTNSARTGSSAATAATRTHSWRSWPGSRPACS